jgi:hypothetical protein
MSLGLGCFAAGGKSLQGTDSAVEESFEILVNGSIPHFVAFVLSEIGEAI